MSYEDRKTVGTRDATYNNMQANVDKVVVRVETWMAQATQLHTNSVTQEERDDVAAARAAFIAKLRTALGI